MEFLGDTVLKMLSTIQVFGDLPEADEDELHTNRARIICNYGLLRMSVKHNIHEYILGIHEVLLPISFMEKKKSEESILNEKSLIIQKEHLKNKNLQQFNKKILADVIESLTGTYYLQYGLEGAQKFLYFTEVLSYPSLYAEIKEIPNTDFSQVKYVMHLKDELTKMFGNKYEIKNMNFFIQALTHASFRKNYLKIYSEKREYVIKIEEMEHQNADLNQETNLQEGDLEKKINQQNEDMKKIDSCLSYQRLEFLGDSILDYYIVSYLFEKYPDNDSGILINFSLF